MDWDEDAEIEAKAAVLSYPILEVSPIDYHVTYFWAERNRIVLTLFNSMPIYFTLH